MKRLALAAVVAVSIMACSKNEEAAVVDTTMAAPAMAPAPAAPVDSMPMDSATTMDSTKTADSAVVPPPAE